MKQFIEKYGALIVCVLGATALTAYLDYEFVRIIMERGGWEAYKQSNFLWQSAVQCTFVWNFMYIIAMVVAGFIGYEFYTED